MWQISHCADSCRCACPLPVCCPPVQAVAAGLAQQHGLPITQLSVQLLLPNLLAPLPSAAAAMRWGREEQGGASWQLSDGICVRCVCLGMQSPGALKCLAAAQLLLCLAAAGHCWQLGELRASGACG